MADEEVSMLTQTKRVIAEHGTQVIGVFPRSDEQSSQPPFAYTIGLIEKFAHAEILVAGLPPGISNTFLNQLRDRVRRGETFEAGAIYEDIAAGFPLTFRTILPQYEAEWLGYGLRYYSWRGLGNVMRAIQLIWPDKKKRFPWDEGFDRALRKHQPLLYTSSPGCPAIALSTNSLKAITKS